MTPQNFIRQFMSMFYTSHAWLAMDSDGQWFVYDMSPKLMLQGWDAGPKSVCIPVQPGFIDWHGSWEESLHME